MSSKHPDISQSDVFDVLSNPRRRFVLYYLREIDETVELNELAKAIAAWENDTDESELTDQDRKRVYVSLYQTHIPKLTDVGLVEYDQDSGTVHLTDRTSVIDDYLTDSDTAIPWHYLYLGLSAVGALAFALVWLEVGLFGAIPLLAVGGLLVASFLVLSVAHYVSTARQHIEMPPE
jgi:DNA-binding transcriptional ArsR family regulator